MDKIINLRDIESARQLYPEPPEIKETRELITECFKDLQFIEDSHQYFVDGVEYPPVSSVCHRFEPEVDWDSIASKKAKKLGIPVEELKEDWHVKNITSTSCGSKTHFFGENLMNMMIGREEETKKNLPFQYTKDGYLIPYCPKEEAIMKYYLDILNNPMVFPVMPEAKIYMKDKYAGTFDILMAYRYHGGIVYSVHDFKTNKDLKNDFNRSKGNRLLPPFDDIIDEPFGIYSIQLSLYQLGLQQLGLPIIDRNIIWLKDNREYEKIGTPDLTERLLGIL